MIGLVLAAALAASTAAEVGPMPRPAPTPQRTVMVVPCGEADQAPPAVVLGDDGNGPVHFAVTLDDRGRWELIAVLPDGALCRIGRGSFLGISTEVQTRGDEA